MNKILLLSPKDNNFYNFRKELILELVRLGYEVVLNCPYGEKIDFFTSKGCRFVDLSIDRRGKSVLKDLKLIKQYKIILKDEKPNIVLTYTSKPSIYAGYLCGKMKIPYIVNNAGLMTASGLFGRFMNFLYKVGFKKASCIMYQNSSERDYIQRLLKNRTHFRDLPGSGVNLEEFRYAEYPSNEKTIIFNYVARIVKIKGIDEFIAAAKIIKHKYDNVEFRIFGDFDDEGYKETIGYLDSIGIVRYCGVQRDMKPWIIECHAAIHPSYYEGMTNVVLEHSAMGRPCLGSDVPGVLDGIDDCSTGYIFKVKDVKSLVDAIEKFILLPLEKKNNMGKSARRKMENEFDRSIVSRTYCLEIAKCLKEN